MGARALEWKRGWPGVVRLIDPLSVQKTVVGMGRRDRGRALGTNWLPPVLQMFECVKQKATATMGMSA